MSDEKEREAFETWAKGIGLHVVPSRRTPGMYEAMDTSLLWEGWTARARVAQRELSDEEISQLAVKHLKAFAQFVGAGEVWYEGEIDFARAILAAGGRQ